MDYVKEMEYIKKRENMYTNNNQTRLRIKLTNEPR
jgi:hypothetical protein